jgi:ABC-2 type transport system ATP-binding protein
MEITTRHLTKRYRGVIALDGIDLDIPQGMFGLLGPNGAGKTTLMRVLAGVISPTEGDVHVGGHDLRSAGGRRAAQRRLGYLPQELGLYPDLSPRSFLDYIALLKGLDSSRHRRRAVGELLELLGLSEMASRKLGTLSGGMKRRVGIAQALIGDPALLIVDEPTAGLDPEERIRFRTLLTTLAGDRSVLLSTHIVEDVAASCRSLAVLAGGRVIYTGEVAGLVATARGRTWLVRLPVGVRPDPGLSVISAVGHGESVTFRVISQDGQRAEGEPVEPTLEDGYVALRRRP